MLLQEGKPYKISFNDKIKISTCTQHISCAYALKWLGFLTKLNRSLQKFKQYNEMSYILNSCIVLGILARQIITDFPVKVMEQIFVT